MGHGLHSLCLQGQEAASLPLVPALLPVPSDLPHFLEGIKLLSWGQEDGQTALGMAAPALRLPDSSRRPFPCPADYGAASQFTFALYSLASRAHQMLST